MFERYRRLAQVCFETPGEGGGGGTGGGGEQRDKVRASDLLTQYSGDAMRMAEKLADALNDNYSLRRKRDDLNTEVTTLKTKQMPEGALVLTGDQVKAWEAFSALGKPEEVSAKLTEADTATKRLTELERDGLLRDAATAAGFKFSVLKDRVTLAGDLPIEVREVEEEGQKVSRAFVKPQGGGEKPLADYAAEHWADYLPALQASQGNGTGQQGGGGGQVIPRQQGSQGPGQQSNVQTATAVLNSTYKGPPQRK